MLFPTNGKIWYSPSKHERSEPPENKSVIPLVFKWTTVPTVLQLFYGSVSGLVASISPWKNNFIFSQVLFSYPHSHVEGDDSDSNVLSGLPVHVWKLQPRVVLLLPRFQSVSGCERRSWRGWQQRYLLKRQVSFCSTSSQWWWNALCVEISEKAVVPIWSNKKMISAVLGSWAKQRRSSHFITEVRSEHNIWMSLTHFGFSFLLPD